jgi:hypothetical protein
MKFNYEKGQEFCTMKGPLYCCLVGVPFYKMLAPLLLQDPLMARLFFWRVFLLGTGGGQGGCLVFIRCRQENCVNLDASCRHT